MQTTSARSRICSVLCCIFAISFLTRTARSAKIAKSITRSKTWCHVGACARRASYKDALDTIRSCPLHRNTTDIPVGQICGRRGCSKQPSFGLVKGGIMYCEAHKEPEHKNVRNRLCEAPNCKKTPAFAVEGSLKAQFCSLHRLAGHVNVVSPRCATKGCIRQPRFGPSGGSPSFCAVHKHEGNVDLKSKRCTYAEGCTNAAIYGLAKDKVPLFCLEHKEAEHFNCKVRLCQHVEGCARQPSYGSPEDELPRFCKHHKDATHIDLKHPCCIYLGCKKQPGAGTKLCAVHRKVVETVRPPLRPTLVPGKTRRRARQAGGATVLVEGEGEDDAG